ncbi:MAG TPA: META domain-containing protein [Caldilineaceae bacterium]|nr:META domain-containing protein [Caldilineaceae bacterium]
MRTVDDPSKYTLTLQPDGKVALQADCNRGGGAYTLDAAAISIEVAVMTRMACPEGSLADKFVKELNAARTYVMDGEDLVLDLFADSGNMRFRRAQ